MNGKEEIDRILEHHGIKGMHWGIRHDPQLVGRRPPTANDIHSNKQLQSDQLKRKYGPYKKEDEDKGFHLTPTEKKVLIGAGIVGGAALAGGAAYLGYRYLKKSGAVPNGDFFVNYYKGIGKEAIKNRSPGLAAHWKDGVSLPTGSIVQRLSTIKETDVRPKGFFAAINQDDVERYKAILPSYWKQWGYKETSGYVVKLRANTPIKAPSGEETFSIFKDLLKKHELSELVGPTAKEGFDKLTDAEKELFIDGLAKERFAGFALHWADGLDNDADVQTFFGMLKERGFNAVIDFNDSGNLAKMPMRFLDGTDFSVAGYEAVSEGAIRTARANLKELVMSALTILRGRRSMDADSAIEKILAHHGVKGMRWGIRRGGVTKTKAPSRTSSDFKKTQALRKKKAHELSNKQLETLNKRLNLEQQHARLNPSKVTRGEDRVKRFLKQAGIGASAFTLFHSPAGKALRSSGKMAAESLLLRLKGR